MDQIPTEITIVGIAANSTYGWAGGTLYLPIATPQELVMSYVETTSPKLGNDSTRDIYNYLTTWTIFDDLSNGAFARFHQPDEKKYWEPVYTAGSSGPLAWTLDEDAPLLPGAGYGDLSSVNYSFSDHEQFKGKIFAIDTKNWRLWRFSGSVWQYYTGLAWTGTPLGGNVTGASNATPIRITSTAHGLTSGQQVSIFNVGGNTGANSTAANPTWYVTVITADTFDLYSDVGRAAGVAGTGGYTSGGTWKCDASGLLAEPTELINIRDGSANNLFIGQTTGYGRYSADADTNTPTWNNWSTKTAQHFALVNKDIYYSATAVVKNDGSTITYKVGDQNTSVNRLEWFGNTLIITKPEGVWVLYPQQDSLQQIAWFRTRDTNNGKVLVIHNSAAYWNADENWFKWDGYNDPEQIIGKMDGNDNRLFQRGKVRAAHSDGQNLFLIWRTDTEETTPYYNDFIVVQSGKTLGYHPIFVASSNTAAPSNYVGGLILAGKKLYFSAGTAATANTGFLLTDGKQPISSGTYPYTWGVGIVTGWFDGQRSHLSKWIMKNIVATRDVSATGTANLTLSYQRWNDTSYTAYPATVSGTKEKQDMTPPAATESGFTLEAGFNASKVRWKLVLNNTGTTAEKAKMFYVKNFLAVGMISYPFAMQAAVNVHLDWKEKLVGRDGLTGRKNYRSYDAATIYGGLMAALNQRFPFTVTFPSGDSALMTALPQQGGFQVYEYDDNTGKPLRGKFGIVLQEMK